MRHAIQVASMALALGVFAGPAEAQKTKVFAPSSAWALDYGPDYCRLMRDFKSGSETIGLFVERTQPGPMARLIVIGDSVKLYRGAQQVGYRMHPSGAPRMAQMLRYQTSDGQQYLNLGLTTFADMPVSLPGAPPPMVPPYTRAGEVAVAATIKGIALDRGLTIPVLIETGELGEAVGALHGCVDDLLASWGLDAELHKSLSRPAMPARPTAGWIAGDAIPFTEFSKLSGGNNELRVMIDRAGKATSCHVQWPTITEAINKKICSSVMKNSEFVPALDKNGNPIDSYWITSIFFLMPPFGG